LGVPNSSEREAAKKQRKYYTNILAKLRDKRLKPSRSTFEPLTRDYNPAEFIIHHPKIELRRLSYQEYKKQFYRAPDEDDCYEDDDSLPAKQAKQFHRAPEDNNYYEDNAKDKDDNSLPAKQTTMTTDQLAKSTKALSLSDENIHFKVWCSLCQHFDSTDRRCPSQT
jgi:hypothetical protein